MPNYEILKLKVLNYTFFENISFKEMERKTFVARLPLIQEKIVILIIINVLVSIYVGSLKQMRFQKKVGTKEEFVRSIVRA